MTLVIDPSSISFSEILQDLDDYIDNKPDAQKWKDFWASGAGQTLKELLAGFSAFLAYRNTVGLRENYLQYAENRASNLAISQTLGYSVYRGQNSHLTLTVTPNVTQTFNKYDVIGTVKDQDLVLLEDKVFNSGAQTTAAVTLGSVKEAEIIAPSDRIQPFRFNASEVSEDIRLFLDDTEVEFDTSAIELANDKWVLITNVYGAVDASYLNSVAPFYTTGSIIKIQYVELKDLSFTGSDLNFLYGTLDSYVIDSVYLEPEPIQEIKVNAPFYHEVQKVIRGRQDYQKTFKTLRSDIEDTNGRDFSPAVVEVTYVRTNLNIFDEVEKTTLEEELSTYRSMGDEPTFISDPQRNFLNLRVIVNLKRNNAADNPTTDVQNILDGHEKQLEYLLDFSVVENEVENMSTDNVEYVETARIYLDSANWDGDNPYRKGTFVKPTSPNGFIYEMSKHIRKTAGVEPTWPTNVGDLITDGEVIWETMEYVYPLPGNPNWDLWTGNNETDYGDIVVPTAPSPTTMFKAIGFINKTDTLEPTFPTTQYELVDDNEVIWMALDHDGGTYPTWAASTSYKTGDIVIPSGGGSFMYQCIGFLSRSSISSTEPIWPTTVGDTIDDNKIRWTCREEDQSPPQTDWNEYFTIEHTLTVNQA